MLEVKDTFKSTVMCVCGSDRTEELELLLSFGFERESGATLETKVSAKRAKQKT